MCCGSFSRNFERQNRFEVATINRFMIFMNTQFPIASYIMNNDDFISIALMITFKSHSEDVWFLVMTVNDTYAPIRLTAHIMNQCIPPVNILFDEFTLSVATIDNRVAIFFSLIRHWQQFDRDDVLLQFHIIRKIGRGKERKREFNALDVFRFELNYHSIRL